MMVEFSVWYTLSTQHMTEKHKRWGQKGVSWSGCCLFGNLSWLGCKNSSSVMQWLILVTAHLLSSSDNLGFLLLLITSWWVCFIWTGGQSCNSVFLWSSVPGNPLLWLCPPTSENSVNSGSYVWYTGRGLFNMLIWLYLPLNFLFHMGLVLWV